mgnify:CR=1 FL=1
MSGDYSFLEVAALASGMQKGMARTTSDMQARINDLRGEVAKGNQAIRSWREHARRVEAQLAETQRLLAEKQADRNDNALAAITRGLKADAIRTVFETKARNGKFAGGNVEAALGEVDYEVSRVFDKLVDAALANGKTVRDPRKVWELTWYVPESR